MTATRNLSDDLFVAGPPPRLLGSRCRETGELFYPVQAMNPVTHRAGTMETCELGGTGRLVNFTRIHRGMPGYDSPLALGIVKLDAGPTLTAQLADWADVELRPGLRVDLVIGPIRTDPDGTRVLGPKFRPIKDENP